MLLPKVKKTPNLFLIVTCFPKTYFLQEHVFLADCFLWGRIVMLWRSGLYLNDDISQGGDGLLYIIYL